MKMIAVSNLILQFDLDCPDDKLEEKVKQFLSDVNYILPRMFREGAPQLLNLDQILNVTVEEFE